MKNSSTNVPYVECPYCDGENAVARIKSDGTAHNLSQCEIACTHCQSLFLLSESKNGVRTRSVGKTVSPLHLEILKEAR